jgi:hypothetical protein
MAIKNDGENLQWASEELRNNRMFIIDIVKKNGKCLKHASK